MGPRDRLALLLLAAAALGLLGLATGPCWAQPGMTYDWKWKAGRWVMMGGEGPRGTLAAAAPWQLPRPCCLASAAMIVGVPMRQG